MTTLRLVLGDQLTRDVAALADIDAKSDIVLMAEVREEATYVRHHQQKIAFLFSAMRHFAQELRDEKLNVSYTALSDPDNSHSLFGEVRRAVLRHKATRVVLTSPGEWRLAHDIETWADRLGMPVEVRDDTRFFASYTRFRDWASGRKELRMEFFYREMRREHELLMDEDEPAGGKWNFDAANRKRLPKTVRPPQPPRFAPDDVTRDVLDLVTQEFGDHFGTLDGFGWAVTRHDALCALAHFLDHALPRFGDYQDAMATGEPFVFHAIISPYLNAGLLTAREVCTRAEREYREGRAPLNAVEGFIRQIVGWREYVRGVYWLKMPEYAESNALGATRRLPWFYWSAETEMRCMREAIEETRQHAYSHHIQRLMVTGNFALLAGVAPKAIEEWYLIVYADAYDWVELPNVHGMAVYADGGLLASKPYAAGGAYIDRMSDFCGRCRYDVKAKSGPDACPFNYLYWAFLIRNAKKLRDNHRLAMPYRTLERFDTARRDEIVRDAETFLDGLDYEA